VSAEVGGLMSVDSTEDSTVRDQSMMVTRRVGSTVSVLHLCVSSQDQSTDLLPGCLS